nr:hypothetical protein [Tanacetum cinerariifolium]
RITSGKNIGRKNKVGGMGGRDESERRRAESQWIVAARPLCHLQYPSSRYDVRGTVRAGLHRARKLSQVATTCEEPLGQVYVVRGKLVKSLRRARNRWGRFTSCEKSWSSRYDVRGTIGAGLRRARNLGWSTTGLGTMRKLESHSQPSLSSGTKSLRRARNRRGRFTSCEETWSSRYNVRGNVGAGLRRARKVSQVAMTCEEPSGQVYDVQGTVGAGALVVYNGPRNVDNLGFGCLLFPLSGTKENESMMMVGMILKKLVGIVVYNGGGDSGDGGNGSGGSLKFKEGERG